MKSKHAITQKLAQVRRDIETQERFAREDPLLFSRDAYHCLQVREQELNWMLS